MKTKLCNTCNTEKNLSEFHRRGQKTQKHLYRHQCKKCGNRDSNQRYYKKYKGEPHRTQQYRNWLRYEHGMNPEDYQKMYDNQKKVCAICRLQSGNTLIEKGGLVVDHCHTKGIIRGLLCRDCNTGIGRLRDNVTNLQRAIDYILTSNSGLVSTSDRHKKLK